MKQTEQELMAKLADAELEYKEAQRQMDKVKKLYTEAETQLINTKLTLERVQESIRVYHATHYVKENGFREKEIRAFQETNPEDCAFAEDRDRNKP